MKTLTGLFVSALFIALVIKFWFGSSNTESSESFGPKIESSYLLTMRGVDGVEFNTSKTYKTTSSSDEIILECSEFGGLFGRGFEGTIRFDPHTLRGTWVTKEGRDVQGGEIHLNHREHGFDFKLFYQFGDTSHGITEAYGSLVKH